MPLQPQLNLRLGFGRLGYSYSGHTDTVDYDLSLKARTYDALLDYYPTQGGSFRITGGLAYNGNKIDVRAKPSAAGSYALQGKVYNAADVGQVTGNVDFGKVSPYLGIGWNTHPQDKGWSVSSDVGVLFQGSPRTTLSNSGCKAPDAVCSQFNADIQREAGALNDEVSKFKLYPVLRIGLSYKF
ncbi:hypothetical protein E4K72_11330 [Oxalobacteraceae bacterium OM1]|nr:hypothetical protein E4K72_11330 [Oxalobacteraceae bacterium OM1]